LRQDKLRQKNGKIMQSQIIKLRRVAGRILACLCLAGCTAFAGGPERLSRTNLLVYHDGKGGLAQVKTKRDWEKRRAEILKGCQEIMGPLPGEEKRCALDVKVESEKDRDTYLERFVTYASEPHSRVPAYLLIPKRVLNLQRKAPAILALHPTDMGFGHKVVVEQMRDNYRAYGRDLVERGYVVLAPAYPLMANYQPDLKALGYQSGTMKAVWDNMRGLDLLESLPFADKERLAAVGHSLGGHNAIYTAVFDKRIKAVISSCGFDSFADYKGGDIKGWTSERYMPRLLNYCDRLQEVPFDFGELLGALAPTPVFINAPLGDDNFKWQSVDEMVRAATPVYELYGAPKNLRVEHPDCAHDFPAATRETAYDWLAKRL
jgi:dienelactone hydrolase